MLLDTSTMRKLGPGFASACGGRVLMRRTNNPRDRKANKETEHGSFPMFIPLFTISGLSLVGEGSLERHEHGYDAGVKDLRNALGALSSARAITFHGFTIQKGWFSPKDQE
ncbi:hypothetical protein VFPPC_18084 [Pochonia chlamydosporia 170]|uniref:Uncharacterized protein n=1 Tax=Pochonia chlamydosporia 170 TaxID=1380566 RepID=A0A219APP5_METCM|nr:hypothetical protein VFPPC_18084 [Pochonia chlamydosporia 170]OWT42671.1 hypothetical protein VFPPC_18084 [Pochonia chlamydosporia 170]